MNPRRIPPPGDEPVSIGDRRRLTPAADRRPPALRAATRPDEPAETVRRSRRRRRPRVSLVRVAEGVGVGVVFAVASLVALLALGLLVAAVREAWRLALGA